MPDHTAIPAPLRGLSPTHASLVIESGRAKGHFAGRTLEAAGIPASVGKPLTVRMCFMGVCATLFAAYDDHYARAAAVEELKALLDQALEECADIQKPPREARRG